MELHSRPWAGLAAAFILAAATAAHAGRCVNDWECHVNGIWDNGIAVDGLMPRHLRLDRAEVTLPAAPAPRCPKWGCGERGIWENGIWENGIALDGLWLTHLQLDRAEVTLPPAAR